MSESFDISQLTEYLKKMSLKLAHVDEQKELVELAFHGNHGQWRMIVGIQQSGDVRKLMLVVPHFGSVGTHKRLECLEALMAANYRIALGKFGLDLQDGEVRLEETLPLAKNTITFAQFQLAFGAMMQNVSIYHSLLPRIIYSNDSVQEVLRSCEQDFFRESEQGENTITTIEPSSEIQKNTEELPELDVDDVLAEVSRMFEQRRD